MSLHRSMCQGMATTHSRQFWKPGWWLHVRREYRWAYVLLYSAARGVFSPKRRAFCQTLSHCPANAGRISGGDLSLTIRWQMNIHWMLHGESHAFGPAVLLKPSSHTQQSKRRTSSSHATLVSLNQGVMHPNDKGFMGATQIRDENFPPNGGKWLAIGDALSLHYPLVMTNSLPWKITILIGKPSKNGPFSMAMLVITTG